MSNPISAPDLTQRPPRSVRVRIGGYALLGRILDKGRATVAGSNGEFNYNCPLDQHFFNFTGIDAEALKTELAAGKGDGEIIAWIKANAKNPRQPWEIEQWSDYQGCRMPDGDAETQALYRKIVGQFTNERADVRTWAEALDLDDYCSFGGKP